MILDSSLKFSPVLFVERATRWSEGPRLDFKEEYYHLNDEVQTFNFVRHIIAFANVARRTGKKCWILFGVADESNEIYDISVKYPGKDKPGGLKNPNNPKLKFSSMMTEDYTKKFRDLMEKWISPDEPEFRFEYGFVKDPNDDIEKFVSYIEILPTKTSRPYQLKKAYKNCDIGTSFVRKNSSSVKVPDSEKEYLLSISESEYIDLEEWRALITYYQSGEFLLQQNLSPWVMPTLDCYEGEAPLDYILNRLESGDKNLILIGNRGEGKSVFLHRLAYKIASNHDQDSLCNQVGYGFDLDSSLIEVQNEDDTLEIQSVINEVEVILTKPIPMFFSLRTCFTSTEDIEKSIESKILESLGRDVLFTSLQRYWNIPGSKWILMLDGVDELQTKESAAILDRWIQNLPNNVRVILTSRPYAISSLDQYHCVSIMPISKCLIQNFIRENILLNSDYFEMYVGEQEIGESKEYIETIISCIFEWIEENSEIYRFLENFRALSGFLVAIIPNYKEEKPQIDDQQEYVGRQNNYEAFGTEVELAPAELAFSEDFTFIGEEVEDLYIPQRIEEPEKFRLPELASILKHIMDYLQADEINRNQKLGEDSKPLAEKSRNGLGKLAWNIFWHELIFDIDDCKEKKWINDSEIVWSEHVGYIKQKEHFLKYSFVNHLARRYFSAEFAWRKAYSHEVVKEIYQQQPNSKIANTVIVLLNELLIENGRDPIEI